MLIVSLGNLIELESTPQSQAVYALDFGPNQLITVHVVPERYDTKHHGGSFCITGAGCWKHGNH